MVQFPDFNKPTKDTFKTNFLEDKFVFKTKTKPNNNLTLSFETSREKGKDYISKLGWNTTFKALDLDFKLDGNVSQVGEVAEELTVKGLYDGLVVTLGGKILTEREENPVLLKGKEEDKKSRDTVSLGFKYAHKHADLSFLVTKKSLNPFLIAGALALHYEDVSIGGDLQYEVEEKKPDAPHFKGYNFGATYRPGDLSLTVLVQESLSNALFGVHHKVNDKTSVAFEFKHLLDKKNQKNLKLLLDLHTKSMMNHA